MTIKQKQDEYNEIEQAYAYMEWYKGYGGCYLPFTFKEYLDNPEKCMARYKSVDERCEENAIDPIEFKNNN
mgnify:CR=1 FL=1